MYDTEEILKMNKDLEVFEIEDVRQKYIVISDVKNGDDEIKDIIRFKIEEKIEEQLNRIEIPLSEIIEEWFNDDNNILWVMSSLKESIENKLYDKKKRW